MQRLAPGFIIEPLSADRTIEGEVAGGEDG